jgi:hypothetical protein
VSQAKTQNCVFRTSASNLVDLTCALEGTPNETQNRVFRTSASNPADLPRPLEITQKKNAKARFPDFSIKSSRFATPPSNGAKEKRKSAFSGLQHQIQPICHAAFEWRKGKTQKCVFRTSASNPAEIHASCEAPPHSSKSSVSI